MGGRVPTPGRLALAMLVSVLVPLAVAAQEDAPATLDHLPEVRHLAAALSDPDSRLDTLFTMVAVAQLLDNVATVERSGLEAASEQFRDDRAWLDRLATRYVDIPMRSTVFDPASWLIVRKLDQHNLPAHPLVSPLGPEIEVLLTELFDRSEERQAASILPEILVRIEIRAVDYWRLLRESALANETLLALVAGLSTDWFDPWTAAEPPAPLGRGQDVLESARTMLTAVADSATLAAPPDVLALKRIRYGLLTADPRDNEQWRSESAYLLRLAAGFESLQQRRHLSFAESLLWVVADILERTRQEGRDPSPTAEMLADLLPRVSNNFARAFSQVDPRINAGLAAAYDVVQNVRGGNPGLARIGELSQELADAVAQIVLLVPDMDYYFSQPVRAPVSGEVDACIALAAAQNEAGESTLTREQFDRCLSAMVDLVDRQAGTTELSGDADGPFGPDHLARELALPPWQRINYVLGYMHDSFVAMCQLPSRPIPNPLEWATLATLMTWFAERAPVYFQTPESEALVMRMREHGMELIAQLSQQTDCFSGAGGGMNDPVSRGLQDYDTALLGLVNGIREAELAFRGEHLKPGADVVLGGDADQRTSYRSEKLVITACDAERTCGMSDGLEVTRALVGLFPDAYLIADQSGLGEVQICYDNVQWLSRRSEPVRPEDPFVANYYGHLAFELKGRYVQGENAVDVFGSRFVSPEEYHYLFAAQDDAILDDSCPLEHVGKRIHAELDSTRSFHIVPNRLTYLASARNRPSKVLADNWGQGAEWRDWFVTGIGVSAIDYDGDPAIRDRVSQHLRRLYQSQQSMVYTALLNPGMNGAANNGMSLSDLTQEVNNRKAAIRAMVTLLYPSQLLDSDSTRAALAGHAGLLDEDVLVRFRDGNIAVSSISARGTLRLEDFRGQWTRLPENVRRSGSVGNSVAHALTRLNAVYREFFALRMEEPTRRGMQL